MTSPIVSLLGRRPADPDLQAGSHGIGIAEIIARYFQGPGEVLTLLRTVRGLSLEELAAKSKIPVHTLSAYEAHSEPSPQHLAALGNALGADLKAFLQAFGAVRADASSESLGLAAQFDGDLSDDQKIDLRKVIEAFVAGRAEKDG